MPIPVVPFRSKTSRQHCTDPVVGAILSGWRYDISGISPDMRVDYEQHLQHCSHCHRKQVIHRTVDVLLLSATMLTFVAFLLAALVLRRVEMLNHVLELHVRLHPASGLHIPDSITISLEAVAIAGVVVSMLVWVLVAMATPITGMVTGYVRQRVSPEARDRVSRRAA